MTENPHDLKTIPDTLPEKLSDGIELALRDLEWCMSNPDYVVNMGDWHGPFRESGPCEVCLAGAVMARSLGISRALVAFPADFNPQLRDKLEALNLVRTGRLGPAVRTWYGEDTSLEILRDWLEETSTTTRVLFSLKPRLLAIATELRRRGF